MWIRLSLWLAQSTVWYAHERQRVSHLNSKICKSRSKVRLWLRHNVVLYFPLLRVSTRAGADEHFTSIGQWRSIQAPLTANMHKLASCLQTQVTLAILYTHGTSIIRTYQLLTETCYIFHRILWKTTVLFCRNVGDKIHREIMHKFTRANCYHNYQLQTLTTLLWRHSWLPRPLWQPMSDTLAPSRPLESKQLSSLLNSLFMLKLNTYNITHFIVLSNITPVNY